MRYRMGDVVTVTGTDCSCGRTGYRIKAHGRADDMLIVRGVNVFPAAIKEIVMQFVPETTGYMKLDIDFAGHSTYDPLMMRVEIAGQDIGNRELAVRVENAVRDRLTVKTQVTLVPEGAIERPGAQKERLIERVVAKH